jgi:hypothetical protein
VKSSKPAGNDSPDVSLPLVARRLRAVTGDIASEDSGYGEPQLAVKYRLLFLLCVRPSEAGGGGVFRSSRIRSSLYFGAGRGGRTGDDSPSAVEVVERAGERCGDLNVACFAAMPSCASAAGGGGEDSLSIIAARRDRSQHQAHHTSKISCCTFCRDERKRC